MFLIRIAFLILSGTIAVNAFADQSGCLKRTIPVGIYSDGDSPAPELSPTNLIGNFHGSLVTVESVAMETSRPRVIFLIDTSGSMRGGVGLSAAFAELVLSKLPQEVEVGLAYFSTKTTPMSGS